jgi:hypothetical protein
MKSVKFSDQVKEFTSYPGYDRSIYRYRYTTKELQNLYINLDLYKIYEMPVHINSIGNNSYHKKFLNL